VGRLGLAAGLLVVLAAVACKKSGPTVDAPPPVPDAAPAREVIRIQQISVEGQA
jgi:hypothetical protein